MKVSLQTKLFLMCILLVLLATVGISTTYYLLTKQDKYRESQQRVQIAFDIMLDDFTERLNTYTGRFREFLKEKDNTLRGTATLYNQDKSLISSPKFLFSIRRVADELKKFGGVIAVERLSLYAADKRLLAVYLRQGDQETVGGYLVAPQTGNNTYLPLDGSVDLTPMVLGEVPIPESPLPAGIVTTFEGDFPDVISGSFFKEGKNLGIRSIAPLASTGKNIDGVLVGEVFYSQNLVERFATLSKTNINLFAGNQLSVGTLPVQTELQPERLTQSVACQDILTKAHGIAVVPMTLNKQDYYQGQCTLRVAQDPIGAITISLSQDIEKQEIKKIFMSVLTIAGVMSVLAFGLLVLFSRKSIRFIQQLITYIDRISKGDIPDKITGSHKGEFKDIQYNLNTLIDTMKALLQETDTLILAVQEGNLETRGNANVFAGGWRELVMGINNLIDAFMVPLTTTAQYLDRIATGTLPEKITSEFKGDFNQIKQNLNTQIEAMQAITRIAEEIANGNLTVDIKERSEQDRLMKALNAMIRRLSRFSHEMDELVQAVQAGKLATRGNIDTFSGGWRDLVVGMNQLIEAFVAPITMTAAYIDQIAEGSIPPKITAEYQGDFNAIKKNLNLLIDATNDITRIAEAIADGNLDIEVRERSEHDRLMHALKIMIQRLNAILQEMDGLTHAVQAGRLATRGQAEVFTGGWRNLVVGVNHVIEAFVVPITVTATALDRLSKGDIPEKIAEDYQGDFNTIKQNLNMLIDAMQDITRLAEAIAGGYLRIDVQERSDQDRLMKALNRMVQRLKEILQETDGLIRAVQEGKLETRGNVKAFEGGWRELVIGINTVIEAFVAPITMTTTCLKRIANGDIPEKITAEYQGDFNMIKQDLNLLIEATLEVTRLAEELAHGNLLVEIKPRSTQDTLMQVLNGMLQKLQKVVIDVKNTADTVASSSMELSARSESMSQGVGEQAAAAEEASSSMEQMTANIRQNADNALQTEKIARQSAEYAEESGKVVAEAVMSMQMIARKITIIEEIADETRMLSLNATLEAARAQETGKAFSVVAAEVRKLSATTKTAAEEINELATSSLDVSARAGEMLKTLLPSIHKTTELVQEINAASGEQTTGAEQINKAIQQLEQVTQQNAVVAEEIASTAEVLANRAEELQHTIAFFKIGEPDSVDLQVKPTHYDMRTYKGKTDQNPPGPITLNSKQDDKKAISYVSDMLERDEGQKGSDDRDAEFERY
jgi:methyl-accepting chemotaxis protein